MDTEAFFKAKRALNEFLEQHPEAKDRQAAIEERLNKAGSAHNRLVVMKMMLYDSALKLSTAMKELSDYFNRNSTGSS